MALELIEGMLLTGIQWLRLAIEATGALIIAVGILRAAWLLVPRLLVGGERFADIRILLAGYLALGLEFQLASDILSTAIAPSWDQIGKLVVIAVIRTALNYFLQVEMRHEKQRAAAD